MRQVVSEKETCKTQGRYQETTIVAKETTITGTKARKRPARKKLQQEKKKYSKKKL